jgi:hypothetical protein
LAGDQKIRSAIVEKNMNLTPLQLKKLLKGSHCKIRKQPKGIKQPKIAKISAIEQQVYLEFKANKNVEILELQPHFVVSPSFERNGKKYQPIRYTADFRILEDGREIIVEVKSTGVLRARRVDYPMRRKLFLRAFPDLYFREIIFDDQKRRTVKEY